MPILFIGIDYFYDEPTGSHFALADEWGYKGVRHRMGMFQWREGFGKSSACSTTVSRRGKSLAVGKKRVPVYTLMWARWGLERRYSQGDMRRK